MTNHYIKIHKTYRMVVSVCDKELLGQKFEEGIRQLDLTTTFFGGEENDSKELVKNLRDLGQEDSTFFIVGEKSTNCAIEAGIIAKRGVLRVAGVPFALVLL
jgi:uncharacterized protein